MVLSWHDLVPMLAWLSEWLLHVLLWWWSLLVRQFTVENTPKNGTVQDVHLPTVIDPYSALFRILPRNYIVLHASLICNNINTSNVCDQWCDRVNLFKDAILLYTSLGLMIQLNQCMKIILYLIIPDIIILMYTTILLKFVSIQICRLTNYC